MNATGLGEAYAAETLVVCPVPGYHHSNFSPKNKNLCEICADGSYLDAAQQNCIKCSDANCAQCTSAVGCSVCKDGYYRDSSGACVACTAGFNCATCSEANKCTSCTVGTPIYFLDPTTKTCGICTAQNAVECASATVATKCATGYFLNSGACVQCRTTCDICANSGGQAGACAKCKAATPATDPVDGTACIADVVGIKPLAGNLKADGTSTVTITITRKATANLPISVEITLTATTVTLTDFTFTSGSATVGAVAGGKITATVPALPTSTFTISVANGKTGSLKLVPGAATGYTIDTTDKESVITLT